MRICPKTSSDMSKSIDNIMNLAKNLSFTDKVQLRDNLNDLVLSDNDPTILEEVKRQIKTINKLIGGDVREPTRKREVVNGRIVLCYHLYRERLTLDKIGKIVGRDHSTITFYLNRMTEILDTPRGDAKLYSLYKRFKHEMGYDE